MLSRLQATENKSYLIFSHLYTNEDIYIYIHIYINTNMNINKDRPQIAICYNIRITFRK